METKHAHNRSYEDFDPVFKWRREEGRDSIELHLPGFRREQIRIQISHLGFLSISGERPLDGTRWRRFKKEFEIPRYCNEDAIRGNFMQNILSVVMPKKTALTPEEEQEEQIPELLEDNIEQDNKTSHENVEFGRRRGTTEKTKTTAKEALEEDADTTDYQFVENYVELTPETTREVALKFMVVIIVILVIVSYLVDMSKSLMAQAHSYFNN